MQQYGAELPKISIIMPVFNNAPFLEKAVISAVNQTYPNTEVIIYDDGSTDPEVRSILSKFSLFSRVRIFWGKNNEGISTATNYAIIQSSGDYLAFLDCDDRLPLNALEKAYGYIQANPHVGYFYSNRENIDENDRVISRSDFAKYALKHASEQILEYMFASHLKIIKKAVFFETGLLKKELDSCQDYDLALRMSLFFSFFHIPETLYQYRLHHHQISQLQKNRQAQLAYRSRYMEIARRKIYQGDLGPKKISIIMLTLNRCQRTRITLQHLVNSTRLPYELIILDNGSTDDTVNLLQSFANQHPNTRLLLEKQNLGCAGGRKKALRDAQGDFIVMIDNDIRVTPWWLEKLLVRLVESQADAACCKVILPNGRIQYNGGSYHIQDPFIRFSFMDSSLLQDDYSTLLERPCDWLPGGATLYRRTVFDQVEFCEDLRGGLEDNDLSLQMNKQGLKMVNCPTAAVIHHHNQYEPRELRDPLYSQLRYDKNSLLSTMTLFYRRNGLIVYDPWVFKTLEIPHENGQQVIEFFASLENKWGGDL